MSAVLPRRFREWWVRFAAETDHSPGDELLPLLHVGIPLGLRAPVARLLRELVEEALPDEAFRSRWAELNVPLTDASRGLTDAVTSYLRHRADPYATFFGPGGWARPGPGLLRATFRLRLYAWALEQPPQQRVRGSLPLPADAPAVDSSSLPRPADPISESTDGLPVAALASCRLSGDKE